MAVLTPEEFLAKWMTSKLMMNASSSYSTQIWKEFVSDLADSFSGGGSGSLTFAKAQADGNSTLTVGALAGVTWANIAAVLVANTNFTIPNEISAYNDVTGTFTWQLDYPESGIPIIIFYNVP